MDIEALENIVAVARAGSISAAARATGQPKQSMSRRLLALEDQLGVRLLERTTHALHLTAEGHALCDRAERILADLAETQQAIAERAHEPEGPLRVSAPMLLGQTLLGAVVADYCRRYPKVDLDVELSDRKIDLLEEGIDVAIRVGPVLDTSLIARLLATTELILVASPAYLARDGTPTEPADLRNHSAVVAPSRATAPDWLLERGRQRIACSARRCCRVSSLKLAVDIVAAGTGIAMIPAFLALGAIESGLLVRVLPEWRGGITEINVVHLSRRLVAPRLRVFIDVLVERFPNRSLTRPS